jgi:hypothetical protein
VGTACEGKDQGLEIYFSDPSDQHRGGSYSSIEKEQRKKHLFSFSREALLGWQYGEKGVRIENQRLEPVYGDRRYDTVVESF